MVKNRVRGMLYGAVIGDMLGVPYEFETKERMVKEPFTGEYMIGGYHDQPLYSWSDDTSMAIAMVKMLFVNNFVYDHDDLIVEYNNWYKHAAHTSNGVVFDCGTGVRNGLARLETKDDMARDYYSSLLIESKGNGSLMKIHPIIGVNNSNRIEIIERLTRVTHDNTFSVEISKLYVGILAHLKSGKSIKESYETVVKRFDLVDEKLPYSIDNLTFMEPSGYAYNTLVNCIVAIYKTDSFRDAITTVINLGGDTDTNASIVGAMAGLIYKLEGIPKEWLAPFEIIDSEHKKLAILFDFYSNLAMEEV